MHCTGLLKGIFPKTPCMQRDLELASFIKHADSQGHTPSRVPDLSLIHSEQHVMCVHVLQAASSMGLNGSSLNSTLNATHNLLLSSASAASALLSNSSLLGTAASQTANITQLAAQHAAAGMSALCCRAV